HESRSGGGVNDQPELRRRSAGTGDPHQPGHCRPSAGAELSSINRISTLAGTPRAGELSGRDGEEQGGRHRGGPGSSVASMDMLEKVEADLVALRRSGALDAALLRWKAHRAGLRSFADAEALIGFLRDPDVAPRRAKDPALAAICLEVTGGDEVAAIFLLWLMLPGLLRVRRRLASRDALAREDLEAELIAGLWESATTVEAKTANVAARLVDRARRRALAAVRQAADWADRCVPFSTEIGEPVGLEDDVGRDILAEAVRAGVISEVEADLLRASRSNVRAVRARLGVTAYAAQNRRRRAKRRLLLWLSESTPVPPPSDSPRTPP
ncbi:MAG TPA: hypothetical protein VFC04_02490, partial [Actinomycetota bacterium]|nr:hypothetical protein [Actinomycetota bacterium]